MALFLGATLLGLGLLFGAMLWFSVWILVGPLMAASFVLAALWMMDGRSSSRPWRAYQGVIRPDGELVLAGPDRERSWPASDYRLVCRVIEGERTLCFLEYTGAAGAVLEFFAPPRAIALTAFREGAPLGATLFTGTSRGGAKVASIGAAALSAWWLLYAVSSGHGTVARLSLIILPLHVLWTWLALVIVLAGRSAVVPCRVGLVGVSAADWAIGVDEVRSVTLGPGTVTIEHGGEGSPARQITLRLAGGSLSPGRQSRLLAAALTARRPSKDGSDDPQRKKRVLGEAPEETHP